MIPTSFVVPSEAFGEAMVNALGEPLARARAGSRVLADQVGETHAPAVRSLVDALDHSERALRDLVEFVRSGEMQVVRRRADLKPVCERVIDSAERRYELDRGCPSAPAGAPTPSLPADAAAAAGGASRRT